VAFSGEMARRNGAAQRGENQRRMRRASIGVSAPGVAEVASKKMYQYLKINNIESIKYGVSLA
jgi:hypothetical protein